ncbi:MAG: phenylalanine--tRNA ligase subunit beta [Spirochaetota bacterium]
MWLSLNILRKLVHIDDISPEEISRQLTMSTAETEGVEYVNAHFDTIVAAKLVSVEKHPDSDKLTVVRADTGSAVYDVVCGAPNHRQGDIAPLALVGTKFSDEFEITETEIRGVISQGMLCSAKELGISDDASGILILDPQTKTGEPMSKIFPDWIDVRIEIDNKSITHRPDLWGHYGFARELAAIFKRTLKDPVDMTAADAVSISDSLSVTIDCPGNAYRYCGMVIRNITVGDSPDWLKSAVSSIGMRPVNNIVDITNYVMAEIGEPMHAFSRNKLSGDAITVRMARQGERLVTLDDQERVLTTDDIVIADDDKAIALGGVMGGANSEIDDTTTGIVLEAASFDAVHIRRSAHRLNLRTDAAMRFEKSLDPELCTRAILRCYQLIRQIIPDAQAVTGVIDCYPAKRPPLSIDITCTYIREHLGEDIPNQRITEILRALEYTVQEKGDLLSIDVPSYRATKDVEIAADIVEEIGRIYGYDNITPSAPLVPCEIPEHNYLRELERTIKSILSRDLSMIEIYNYSFVGEDILKRAGLDTHSQLRLQNPLSVEHDRLRTDLVPGIIQAVHTNMKHSQKFSLYEMGRVYIKQDRRSADLAREEFRICGAYYSKDQNSVPFYDAKHAVRILCEKTALESYSFTLPDSTQVYMHPGRVIDLTIDGNVAGHIFEVSPVIQKQFDIPGRIAVFDISVHAIYDAKKSKNVFTGIRKYPDVLFEMSVISDEQTYAADIVDCVQNSAHYIQNVSVLSVYTGDPVPAGKKSVSLRIVFNGVDHTLSPEETLMLQNSAVEAIKSNGYELR